MADINNVVLVGRLGRDCELKHTSAGTAIARFSIAVNHRRQSGDRWVDEAHWFDCAVFGRTAESLERYLVKGKQVGVSGSLRQNRWQDDSGRNRNRVEIAVRDLQLLGDARNENGAGSRSNGDGGYRGSQRRAAPAPAPQRQPQPAAAYQDDFDDDIPF